MKTWILDRLAKLPIWTTWKHKGRRKHEPWKGKVFVVTSKDIWFFGWARLIVEVEYLDPKVTRYFLRLHAEKQTAPAPAGE